MESIHVSFEDKKITGLEDFTDHDQLRFEDEEAYSDSINSNSETIPESVNPSQQPQAHVEGEHFNNENMDQNNEELSENTSSDASSPDSDISISEDNENIPSRGASENQNAYGDSMDYGGESSSRGQLPHAKKWTKSHTPDLIIGNPDA
ncbi:hypothetical protein ACET3Z_013145 [Daucus carota]